MKLSLPAGTAITHYCILSPLGAGGMGEVYLAEDINLRRKVALKLLSAGVTREPNRVKRFQQEARSASALNHPNIITIYDFGESGGAHYMATEYVEGITLRKRLSEGKLSVDDALAIAVQVASALAEAHSASIVHRDIKPENIMIRPSGLVKVLDFGLAKLAESSQLDSQDETKTVAGVNTAVGTLLGTLSYMSPEQARGQKVDTRSDIFSFGIVLHEMIVGKSPFRGETSSHSIVAILEKDAGPLSRIEPRTPPELERIVAKALRKDREERYQTAKDLLLDLKTLKQDLELQARLGRIQVRESHLTEVKKPVPHSAVKPLTIVVLYRRKAQPDEQLLEALEQYLTSLGHEVFIDRHLKIGVEWAKAIEARIRSADAVIALLSNSSAGSDMLEYELETASDEARKRGKPHILPVRIGSPENLDGAAGAVLERLNYCQWNGPEDNARALSEIAASLAEPAKPKTREVTLEPVGGAVPPGSPFYIERRADPEFLHAIEAGESIVLIKGPRQMGKTSLLGRGAQAARNLGYRHAFTDFQKFSTSQMSTEDQFYRLLAATLSRQLGVKYDFENEWLDVFGPGINMDNFIRAALEEAKVHVAWFMDEADKLFSAPFASDFFGLVRSWHNSRATEPHGPWNKLTVVISYATEAHLFIQDLNQSPFNVGRQLQLQGFNREQIEELNRRYGAPLTTPAELQSLQVVTAGQPFLTRRALDVIQRGVMDFPSLLANAARDDGPFGDHLKRILVAVSQLPEVVAALKSSLESPQLKDAEGIHRLLSSGVLYQTSDNRIAFTCDLYRQYLGSHLAA
jgi:serine/threonine protein kinase